MVERLLTIKKDELNNGNGKMNRLEQSQSFNTEDDESISPDDPQQLSETDSRIAKSRVDDLKRGLLSIHTPSIDSINDTDGLSPDTPLSEKAKRKKLRRATEQMVIDFFTNLICFFLSTVEPRRSKKTSCQKSTMVYKSRFYKTNYGFGSFILNLYNVDQK
jgi:hypothetical protein